jgi:hypothetical protein
LEKKRCAEEALSSRWAIAAELQLLDSLLLQSPTGIHSVAMRRLPRLLCVFLSISILLAPVSTLHAHPESEHHAGALHGGHVHHDAADDQSGHGGDSVVDVQFAMAGSGLKAFSWTLWLPLFAYVAVFGLAIPYLPAILRPPPRTLRLPQIRIHHWQPPLRGPPALPISIR